MGTAHASVLVLADADGAPRASYALSAGLTAPLLEANDERPSEPERSALQSPSTSANLRAITALQCSPDCARLAAGLSNGRVALLDLLPDGSLRPTPPPPQQQQQLQQQQHSEQTTRVGCLVLLVSLTSRSLEALQTSACCYVILKRVSNASASRVIQARQRPSALDTRDYWSDSEQ